MSVFIEYLLCAGLQHIFSAELILPPPKKGTVCAQVYNVSVNQASAVRSEDFHILCDPLEESMARHVGVKGVY
jgi:hypothetical protein